jgi:DMSO/TMAO reductase YedYZ heme-binding membrane subunit
MSTFTQRTGAVLAVARVAPATVLVSLVPLTLDALRGLPGAATELHDRLANVLGLATMLSLLASYAVTPLATVTGWRWHVILRRDFGLWACVFAFTDLVAAAAADGVLAGTAGTLGLAAGTLATLLLVPLAVTSNRLSMRWLGRYWKQLHGLIYVIFALVVVHLCFVGSALTAAFFATMVALLATPRHPRVARWFVARRGQKEGSRC